MHSQAETIPSSADSSPGLPRSPAVSSNGALLELSAIAKVFHTAEVETHALVNVHLKVGKGEFLSINGPSGSGKSSLLAILGLLDTPTAGEYRLGNELASDLSSARRA